MDVSVIVPVRNGARTLRPLLEALAAQDYPAAQREAILVDNGSTDDTPAILRDAERAGFRSLREPAGGSYAARNAGVQAASGKVLAFTDADSEPSPDWLSAGLAAMRERGLDVLSGDVRQEASSRPGIPERIDRIMYLRQAWYAQQGFGATANLFTRREVFDALGGFDPRLISSGDRVFCHRALAAGFRFGYCQRAVVRHLPRRSVAGIVEKELRLGYGFAQIARLGLDRDGLSAFAQTYLPAAGIRGCFSARPPDIGFWTAVGCLAAYSLIRLPCRTSGFLWGVLRGGRCPRQEPRAGMARPSLRTGSGNDVQGGREGMRLPAPGTPDCSSSTCA